MGLEIVRAREQHFEDAWRLLQEYFAAVQVMVRDDPEAISEYLRDDRSGVWLAFLDGEASGCIVLRPLDAEAGEIKRLYVRPYARRHGIANRLLCALEWYAGSLGMTYLYLDTKDDLTEAIAFYKRSGYSVCERYNDNPQATLFMRKTLPGRSLEPAILVREFRSGDEQAFWSLNEAWISKLFRLEEKDYETLRNPQKYVLDAGGRIYMACRGGEAVGCCALLNLQNGSYELAKMGVAESERGKGVGRTLLKCVVAEARRFGVGRLYLETNHALKNAIHLYESVGFTHVHPEAPSPFARADVFMELVFPRFREADASVEPSFQRHRAIRGSEKKSRLSKAARERLGGFSE